MPASVRVEPISRRRRQEWSRIFRSNVTAVPVKTSRPRWQELEPGSQARLAFDLDTSRLTPPQRSALINHVATVAGVSADEAAKMVEAGVPVDAAGCRVIVDEGPE